MSSVKPDNEDKYATLLNNAGAIRAICAAVEGTLGPKGLDTMLVGSHGEVIITNDGVTILEQMDVTHPAARLLIQVARAQQKFVGDGTTTATVLAGALVAEAAAQVTRGVPVAKVVRGIQEGSRLAAKWMAARARRIEHIHDPLLYRVAYVASREQDDIASLVLDAAEVLGEEKLKEDGFRFAELVSAHGRTESFVWPGIIVAKVPLGAHLNGPGGEMPFASPVLVLNDAFEPEATDEETLVTEAGFRQYMLVKEKFKADLEKLSELGVGLIVTDRGVDPEAEQFCADRGIMVLQRVTRDDMRRICTYTGAAPVRRTALKKAASELAGQLGYAGHIVYDERMECVRLKDGCGRNAVTVVVGGSTGEVVGERARIAKDAASAVQAALKGGYVAGGGAVEISIARDLERYSESVQGMESFGFHALAQALRKPLTQIVVNAGYNPLEKVEEVKAAQLAAQSDSIGIDCDTGRPVDFMEAGVIDPAAVKLHALEAAAEVATAVLRIHTVIKMKQIADE